MSTETIGREYATVITLRADWIDPANGRYIPSAEVEGDLPDGLDKLKVASLGIKFLHTLFETAIAEMDE